MNNIKLEVGRLLSDLEPIISSQEKTSSVIYPQATRTLNPTLIRDKPSYTVDFIINNPPIPSHSVGKKLERNISLYPPIPFKIPVTDFPMLSNSSQAHSQNNAASNQDEDSETETETEIEAEILEDSSYGQNKTPAAEWTREQNLSLMEIVYEIGKDWQTAAKNFPDKTSAQVKHHYQDLQKTSLQGVKKLGKWSESESKLLMTLISQHGDPSTYSSDKWNQIATQIGSRTIEQIRAHWMRNLNPKLKKFAFTPEEDLIIMQKMQIFGNQWSVIAKSLPGRTGQQIKQHYENSLDNSVRRSSWTKQEEQLLKDGVTQFGNKWAKVAEFINGSMRLDTIRTGKQCYNQWKRLSQESSS